MMARNGWHSPRKLRQRLRRRVARAKRRHGRSVPGLTPEERALVEHRKKP